jgi:predicted Zn-dependent peptidase
MAFKGTKKRPSTLAISSAVDGVGGVFNAYTDKEFTGYFIKLPAGKLTLALDILSDMLTSSLYKKEEIEREKGVICEEINMREDTPMTKTAINFERLIYGDNSMGWDIAGEKEIVQKIQRPDFLEYLARLYYAGNMAVAVAGGVGVNQVNRLTKLIGEYFGGLRQTGQKQSEHIKLDQVQPRIDCFYKKTEQAHFCLGVPGYNLFNSRRYALAVLTAILGGGMSSRLFTEIRERRGLAYYVGADLDIRTDVGFLVGRAGVKLTKIEEVIKVTLAEMQKMAAKKVGTKELNRVKEMIRGHLTLSQEDTFNVAERYLTQLILEKEVRPYKEVIRLIDRVNPDDVLQVALDLFKPEKLNLAIVGPFKEKSRFSKLLSNY